MIKIKSAAIILSLALTASCCYKHRDYISSFLLKGQIADKHSGLPLRQIKFFFVDTGLDYKRSKYQHTVKIGESDMLGNINAEYSYWWGRNEKFFNKKDKHFAIELRGEHYISKRIYFSLSDLIRSSGKLNVPLGIIYLEPR